jgi:8-oxo-dGTP diphosphatase
MKKLNVILLFNKDESKVLMCLREKEPYKGLFNLVGGKLEEGETELEGAYRELEEETGITKDDVLLSNLMNFQYIKKDFELEVYSGRLNKDVELVEEVNKLYWIDSSENFFNKEKFAGEGNIGVMYETYLLNKDKNEN